MRSPCGAVCCSLFFLCSLTAAADTPLTVIVSSELAPPGAATQIKFSLARPQPVAGGVITVDLDPAFFGDAVAASAFSAAGDAHGYVILAGHHVEIHFASDSGSIGLVNGLPVCTITAPILATAPPGSKAAITASAGNSSWTVAPGTVTADGTLSVQRVEPSAGELAAGSVIHIFGTGFTASTAVDIAGAVVSSVRVQGSDQIDVTLGAPVEITGHRVRVQDANGGPVDFFPAFLADPVTTSPDDPLMNARPILPLQTQMAAAIGNLFRETGWIVVQNPNGTRVDAAIQRRNFDHLVSEQTLALAPGAAATVAWSVGGGGGDSVRVLASAPVRSIALWEQRDRFGTLTSSGSQPTGHSPLSPTPMSPAPDSISWVWKPGTSKPPSQVVTVYVADPQPVTVGVAVATESGGAWLSATPQSLVVDIAGVQGQITVAADPAALGPGIYRGTVTITPAPVAFRIIPTVVVPVVLTVSETPVAQTVSACCFQFATPSGAPQSHVFTISPDLIPGDFSTAAFTDGGGDWLAVRVSATTSPAEVTVSLKSGNTPAGNSGAEVLVTGSGGTVYMPITYRVYGGTQLYTDDYYLLFNAKPGDTALPAITTKITARCVEVGCAATGTPVSIPWTPSVRTNAGGNWLAAASAGGDLKVSANAAGLAPGVYTGVVTLTSTGASGPTQVPVVLVVFQPGGVPALTANPSSLSFSTTAGLSRATCVQAGRMNVPLTVATSTINGGNWLRAANTTVSEFPCVINVTVNTASLAPGTYTGKVTASAFGQSVNVPVNLVIPADSVPPFVGAVVNSASGIEGPSSPGGMITIHGNFDPLRCNCPVTALVDGVAVAILSSSATSLMLPLPRRLAGKNAATLQVNYRSDSTLRGIPLVDSAPGIFALDGSGQGPAAVLNQDNSVNGAASPADRGSVIQIFATGIGDGPVGVAIGGVAARVTFAGPAPGAVEGLYQINAVVPLDAPVGPTVPIVLSVGPHPSQDGVTIAVR